MSYRRARLAKRIPAMISTLQKTVLLLLSGVVALPLAKPDEPDIRTVSPDLTVPKLSSGPAAPGRRIKKTLPGYAQTKVYHVTYLPTDWEEGKRYPVIIEYAGTDIDTVSCGQLLEHGDERGQHASSSIIIVIIIKYAGTDIDPVS